MTRNELIAMLLEMKGDGKQIDLAAKLGVTPQYLGDVLAGKREPGEKILKTLRLERVVSYCPVKPARKK